MPIYEYECKGCGDVFEEMQKMSDPPLKKCPHCGGKVNKLMSMNTFHLKGSGWYVTDYTSKNSPSDVGSKSESKSESSEKKPETTSSDTASAKKETKTETKTDV